MHNHPLNCLCLACEAERALPSIEDVAGKFELGYTGDRSSPTPEHVALKDAVVEAAVRYCSFSDQSIISDANDQAWRDLSDAVDALQRFRETT